MWFSAAFGELPESGRQSKTKALPTVCGEEGFPASRESHLGVWSLLLTNVRKCRRTAVRVEVVAEAADFPEILDKTAPIVIDVT